MPSTTIVKRDVVTQKMSVLKTAGASCTISNLAPPSTSCLHHCKVMLITHIVFVLPAQDICTCSRVQVVIGGFDEYKKGAHHSLNGYMYTLRVKAA